MIPYLNILGKRLSIAAQWRRRVLVVAEYALFLACMAVGWRLDQWQDKTIWAFNSFGLLVMWISGPVRNPRDERELRARERAYRYASRAVLFLLFLIWIFAVGQRTNWPFEQDPSWTMRVHHPVLLDNVLYFLIVAALFVEVELPNSIILWTEPDMVPADEVSAGAQS